MDPTAIGYPKTSYNLELTKRRIVSLRIVRETTRAGKRSQTDPPQVSNAATGWILTRIALYLYVLEHLSNRSLQGPKRLDAREQPYSMEAGSIFLRIT